MLPSQHQYFTRYTPFALMGLLALVAGAFFTVINVSKPQESRSRASTANILSNPGFESGKNSWYHWNRNGAASTFSTTTSEKYEGATSAQVNVTRTGLINEVELAQYGISVTKGKTYTVSFAAKASPSREVNFVVQDSASPYNVYMRKRSWVSSSWTHYKYTFTATETKPNCLIGIQYGTAKGTVWADAVSFLSGDAPVSTPTPTVYQAPTSTPTPTQVPTPTPYSAPTATPTILPTATPTTAPTVVPTAAQPTSTPMPTPTLVPGSTNIALSLGLHGLGKGGDSANPNGTGNTNPLRPQRTVTVEVYNDSNALVKTISGAVAFDSDSGHFKGLISLGADVTSGAYQIRVKTDQFLRTLVPGIQTLTSGQIKDLPLTPMVNGDITNDNLINILDYNILMGCYSDLSPAVNCPAGEEKRADITDDGAVNQFDYNLFLRELINRGGN